MPNNRFRRGLDLVKPFVLGPSATQMAEQYKLTDIMRLAANESPLPPFQVVLDNVGAWILDAHRYPEGNDALLRTALVTYLDADSGQIVIANGSSQIILAICLSILEPRTNMIVSELSFPLYNYGAALSGASLRAIPQHADHTYNLDRMLSAVTANTRIIVICNPNNPTGTLIPANVLDDFLHAVPRHVLVVVDEAYIDFVDNSLRLPLHQLLCTGENVIVVRTFSKLYSLAGLRIGYGVGAASVIGEIAKIIPPYSVSTVAQRAAIESLRDQEEVQRRQAWAIHQRVHLTTGLDRLGVAYALPHGNFVFAHLGAVCAEVQTALLEKGVWVRETQLANWFRVTVGAEAQNTHLLCELERQHASAIAVG